MRGLGDGTTQDTQDRRSKRYVELDDTAVAALTNQYAITGQGDGLVFLNPTKRPAMARAQSCMTTGAKRSSK